MCAANGHLRRLSPRWSRRHRHRAARRRRRLLLVRRARVPARGSASSPPLSATAAASATTPTYEQVSRGNTMHAEAVEIVYDEKVVSARTLTDLLWQIHDPTTLNRQAATAARSTAATSGTRRTRSAPRSRRRRPHSRRRCLVQRRDRHEAGLRKGRAVLEGGGLPPAISAEGRPGRDEGQPQADPVLRTARPDQEDGQGEIRRILRKEEL